MRDAAYSPKPSLLSASLTYDLEVLRKLVKAIPGLEPQSFRVLCLSPAWGPGDLYKQDPCSFRGVPGDETECYAVKGCSQCLGPVQQPKLLGIVFFTLSSS